MSNPNESAPLPPEIRTGDLSELAALIHFRVGAWEDLGYRNPPTPDCKTVPPLGERSADAIKAGHDAIEDIDQLIRKLYDVRSQLVSQLRRDEDIRMARPLPGAVPTAPEADEAVPDPCWCALKLPPHTLAEHDEVLARYPTTELDEAVRCPAMNPVGGWRCLKRQGHGGEHRSASPGGSLGWIDATGSAS